MPADAEGTLVQDSREEDTLARWLREEREVLAASPAEPGVARPEQAAGRPGIEFFRSMLAGEIPRPPMCGTLDFVLVQIEPGLAVFQGTPLASHYNPLGTVHGGWYCTLLDSAVGCAIHAALPAGKAYTTIELKVNLVRALTDRIARVRAEGRVIHLGGRVATAEGKLVGPDGKLYAHATTTCLVMDAAGR